MNQNQSKWDVIVIGAGLGGLSAAAHLAACGKRTLLLERYSVLGGSSHVFRRKKAWEFDCGVHYIGDCGSTGQVPTLFRGLGLDDRIEWLPLDNKGFDTIIGPDLHMQVPHGWDQYLENLIKTFPKEEKALRRYISILSKIAKSKEHDMYIGSKTGMARWAAKAGWAAPWLMMPHAALMVACGLSQRAALTLAVRDSALGSTVFVMPVAQTAILQQNFVGRGAWYPKGGGQILAAGFAEVIRSHGGMIKTQVQVDKICLEEGKVKGVQLSNGEILHTDVVVSGADIKRTYRDLVGYENLPNKVIRRNENWKMSYPMINGFFGVEIDIAKTPNSNFYAIPNWDATASWLKLTRLTARGFTNPDTRDPIAWAKHFAQNQPSFVQCSTRRDPSNHRSAPVGHAAIEVQTLAPSNPQLWGFHGYDIQKGDYRRNPQYQHIKEIILDGFTQRIEQTYPGASANIKFSELGTPASQERFTYTSQGSAFGLEPRISQFGPFRPGVNTVIKGLYLVGTSTVWGPGTEGAMFSGLHAASAITGRDLHAEISAGVVLADRSLLSKWSKDFDAYSETRMLGKKNRLSISDQENTLTKKPYITREEMEPET